MEERYFKAQTLKSAMEPTPIRGKTGRSVATGVLQMQETQILLRGEKCSKKYCIAAELYYSSNTHMQQPSFTFIVHPSSGVPIYRQLMDQVSALVAGGKLQPGDVIPSVRQMAADLGVNMMTVSKAYAKLEAAGILEHSRGKGMLVAEPKAGGTVKERQAQLRPLADQAVVRGLQLGLTPPQILDVVKASLEEHQS